MSTETDPMPGRIGLSRDTQSIDSVGELKARLEYYKQRAFELDNMVFQMRTLLQSGKGFSEILNLESLLQAFMAVCRERYDVVSSAVLLLDDLDPDNVFFRVRAHYGLPERYVDTTGHEEELLLFRIPQDQGLLWQMIQQGEAFQVRDMQHRPRFDTAFRKWSLAALESEVWVPLMRPTASSDRESKSRVLGILTLGEGSDGSQIPEADYGFLADIAAVAATNIDSTLKYEKNARILANLRTLYDVNQQLANVNDFKKLTIETLSTAVAALKAQKANLMLYNQETEHLEIKVVWGDIPKPTRDAINDGQMETKTFALGEGVAGLAAKHRRPVRRNDRTKIDQVGKNEVYCILSVPLMYGGSVVGVMTLTNKVKRDAEGLRVLDTLGRFGEDDEHLLLGLADQAAVNLHKARLYSASITDRLTGLFNARHFETSLDLAIAGAVERNLPLSLAVIDIDHFKRFNDTYGHKAGDFVLAETARLASEIARDDDSCYRYGGEEFCILFPETGARTACEIVEALRLRVAETTFDYEGQHLSVTISAGVSCCPVDADNRGALFESADRALYASKEAGRNQVHRIENGQPVPIE